MALSELAAAMPVDLMPGAGDPATAALPQQPLHRCLLPGAAAFPTLNRRAALSAPSKGSFRGDELFGAWRSILRNPNQTLEPDWRQQLGPQCGWAEFQAAEMKSRLFLAVAAPRASAGDERK